MGGAGERLAGAHALAQLAEEIRGCTPCPLAAHRTLTVPGEGNVLSDVMLVGEAPVAGRLRRAETGQHIFPMYHPAAALHQASLRETLFRDVRGLPAALLAARQAIEDERMAAVQAVEAAVHVEDDAAPGGDTEQMTLFQEQ